MLTAPLLLTLACARPATTNPPDNGWKLMASDEFEGTSGTAPDPTKWVHDVGGDGWGNDQLEYDTDRTDNAFVDGDGNLVIRAQREEYEGNSYTSARLTTRGTLEQTYGRIEARMQMPAGAGLWPAFWMLGANIDEVGWPTCGEIDIVEAIGTDTDTVFGTIHGPGYSGDQGLGDVYNLPAGAYSDQMHVYAIEWDPEQIAWYVDDVRYQAVSIGDADGPWVFDAPFYIILNLAVGGTLGGDPDPAVFPAELVVDYVRVYTRSEPVQTSRRQP